MVIINMEDYYPKIVALVTSGSIERKTICTVAWHTPLSHHPHLYGISIGKTRFTHTLINETKSFAVNFLSSGFQEQMSYCGTITGKNHDKFESCGFTPAVFEKSRSVYIRESYFAIGCKLVNSVDAGDHTFFIGEIVDEYRNSKKRGPPPLYTGGAPLYTVPRDF